MMKSLKYLMLAAVLSSSMPAPKADTLDLRVLGNSTITQKIFKKEIIQPLEEDNYSKLLKEIKLKHNELSQKYTGAKTKKEKDLVLNESRDFLFETITEQIIPPWFGTPWEFYGATETPGKGAIACGYFVNTILEHVGFRFNRKEMSQQMSEYIIRTLTEEENITRFRDEPLDYFIEKTKEQGEGLYIIGLDYHTGFIVNDGTNLKFCHSAYLDPYNSVTCEKAKESIPIIDSQYRVIGKILSNNLLDKWLNKEFIRTVRR